MDIGASATKLVLLNSDQQVLVQLVQPSGINYQTTANDILARALAVIGATSQDIARIVSTGYGRHNVSFSSHAATEIQCHARGCHYYFTRPITVVDIGGQDNKIVYLDHQGRHTQFKMNRKCAAGTGAFVEEIALRLALPLASMSQLAQSTTEAVSLSSYCTVFAKTEILAHLRRGVPVEQILRGAYRSIIQRILEMDPLAGEVILTGGVVAHHPIVVELFAEHLGRAIHVPSHPQFTGALGAALLALNNKCKRSGV